MEKGRFLISHTDHINQSEFDVAWVDEKNYHVVFSGFIDSGADRLMAAGAITFLRGKGIDAYLVGNDDDHIRGIYEWFEVGMPEEKYD
jgi:hypothetical protein